ncbi:sigma factor-like helix-turn-helix DNA-binding protein [Streptomyces sp. NPDC048057]|uniref:sigma factor-like helix-turn-helix DNA-binding protein n=1 Tax=Streptomyces sp. NPDC048057 TaxID=3155628 RepID=UPI0033D9371C
MTQSTAPSPETPLPTPKERRRLREALSLSEEQVANAVGVTKATVRAWETGRSDPRGRRREAYAKVLARPLPSNAASTPDPSSEPAAPTASTAPVAATTAATAPMAPTAVEPAGADGTDRTGATDGTDGMDAAVPRAEEAVAPSPPPPPPLPPAPPAPSSPPALGLTPAEAFDALYAHAASDLVRQVYLLTGRQQLSHEAVERAFHIAWQNWPKVAQDRDPIGWVRAVAYELALSPWHRLRPAHRHPESPPLDKAGRELLDALLELPPAYRRTVLLYDGLGLDLPETAAETEATTPAAANRLLHAREVLAERLPHLAASPEALREQLGVLVAAGPPPRPAPAATVRTTSERRAWFWTRAALTVTVMIMGATGMTLATAPTRYVPEIAPAQRVGGVPGHAGPPQLGPQETALRDMLRDLPGSGPGKLVPQIE